MEINMDGVVMLVNEFAPVSGGAEKQAERLASYLTARGIPVWVITRHLPGLLHVETMNGFQVLRPVTWGPGKIKTLTFIIGALWILWRLRRNYSILHAHMLFGPAFAASLAGYFLGKQVIVKLGSSGPDGEIQTSLRSLRGRVRLAFLRRWVDVMIALDDDMQAEALSVGIDPSRIARMVNGIDVAALAPLVSRGEAKSILGVKDNVVALFVGRLVVQKALPTLMRAMQKAIQACPSLCLLLVGMGPEHDHLQALVTELGIRENVIFAGNQSNVKPYLHAADIFVLPSETEGMSNALMEAMAVGLPCIATPVGASPKMLDQGKAGILVPVGDSDAMAHALIELTKKPELRVELGNAAHQRIKAEYDFAVIGAQYEMLYQNLIKRDVQ
jgi:glycosyltransferase involved in cell wall biosynthesis